MANGTTLTVEEFTKSVAEEIASQLRIQPDVLVSKLVDSLSKGLIEKFVGRPISQSSIKQTTKTEEPKPAEKQTKEDEAPLVNNKAIEETIITKIPKMVEKLTEIANLIGNVFDNRGGITRQEKFPDILKTPLQKLTKDFEATSKAALEFDKDDDEDAEGVEPTQQQTFLEKDEKPKPVLFAGFTAQGLKELQQVLPSILDKEGVKALVKKKEEAAPGGGGGFGFSLPGGLLKGALAAISTLGGLLAIFYGLQTEGPFKGIAKLVGTGMLAMGGFQKRVQKIVVSMVDNLIALPKKLIRNFARGIAGIFGKGAGAAVLKTGLSSLKGFIPTMLKGLLTVFKRIPLVGTLISIGFAVSRFKSGDIVGGGLEILSGLLGLIPPPIGTILGLAVDAFNAFLDFKAGGIGENKKQGKGEMIWNWVKGIGKWLGEKIMDLPILGPTIKGIKAIFNGEWMEGLKQFAKATPIGMIMDFFGSETGKKTLDTAKGAAKGIWDWIKGIGKWMGEKLYNMPIIGNAIKGVEALFAGEWKEALKQFALATPIGAAINALMNLFGDDTTPTQQDAKDIKPPKSPFEKVKESIVNAAKNWWKNTYNWVKWLAKKVLPENIISALEGGTLKQDEFEKPTTTTAPTQQVSETKQQKADNQNLQTTTPTETKTKMEETNKEQLSQVETKTKMEEAIKQPLPEVVEPVEVSSAPELQKEVSNNVVNNYALGNEALNKIAGNSDITNKNIANLVGGFNTLAVALEKLGVSIKDAPGNTTVISQGDKGNKGAVARSTEFAKVGNTTISDFRRFVEASRLVPA